MRGLGWILLANKIAWLPVLVSQPKPIAYDNQYDSCFEVTWIITNAIFKQNIEILKQENK